MDHAGNKIRFFVTLLVTLSMVARGQTTKTFEFDIKGMTCEGCVNTASQTLKEVEGVETVTVDLKSEKATVSTNSKVTRKELESALEVKTNFEALFPGEALPQPLTEKEKEGLDIKTITGGNKINFSDHLAQGKITIFDFYADWCGPCRVFSPKLEQLLLENENLALRKVDLVDWKSDLARQMTKKYQLPALPFTLIFDGDGKLMGKVEGNNIKKVKEITGTQ